MNYSTSSEIRERAWNALGDQKGNAVLVTLVFWALSAAASSLTWGALTILLLPMQYAFCVMFLRLISEEREVHVSDLFTVYRDQFERSFLLELLVTIYTFLWTLLFVIPGIIKTYSYAMAPYLLQENPEMTASEAINESMRIMDGNKARLFWLDLSFIGWYLLSMLTFGLLLLIVVPYHMTARAEFYQELKNGASVDTL